MLGLIDIIYLGFAAVSLYFTFLFFILFFENRGKIHETPESGYMPSVSLIIPAHNEEKAIGDTIKAVKGLSYPKNLLEVIVVDDGSSDKTYEIASKAGVKALRKKRGGKASALNFGIARAGGEIVGCVDADSYPDKDALLKSVPFLSEKEVAAVTTSIFVKNPKNLIQRLQNIEYTMIVWARKLLEFLNSVYVTPGPLSLYRKSILKKVGGFDEKNLTEDIEIAWRLLRHGYKIKMASDARVFTRSPEKFSKFWRQRLRWNIGGIQTSLKYRYTLFNSQFKSLGGFVLPFFAASYVLSLFGFGVFLYLLGRTAYDIAYYAFLAPSLGISPIRDYTFFLLPNVFMIFGLVIFALSLAWVIISFRTVKASLSGLRVWVDLVIYLSLYITIFPIILIHSTWRWLKKSLEW